MTTIRIQGHVYDARVIGQHRRGRGKPRPVYLYQTTKGEPRYVMPRRITSVEEHPPCKRVKPEDVENIEFLEGIDPQRVMDVATFMHHGFNWLIENLLGEGREVLIKRLSEGTPRSQQIAAILEEATLEEVMA